MRRITRQKEDNKSFSSHLPTAERNFSDRCTGASSNTKIVGLFTHREKSSIERIRKSLLMLSALSYVTQNYPGEILRINLLSYPAAEIYRCSLLSVIRRKAISDSSKLRFHPRNINQLNRSGKPPIICPRLLLFPFAQPPPAGL